MKCILVASILLFGVKFSYAQCDSLKTSGLRNIALFGNPSFTSVKFSFDKIGEDSTSYVYGRCPWRGEPKCLQFEEFFFISKINSIFRYFQCYDVNTYTRIKNDIVNNSVMGLKDGNNFHIWESMFVNFTEQVVSENPCNVKKVYTIEFLHKK